MLETAHRAAIDAQDMEAITLRHVRGAEEAVARVEDTTKLATSQEGMDHRIEALENMFEGVSILTPPRNPKLVFPNPCLCYVDAQATVGSLREELASKTPRKLEVEDLTSSLVLKSLGHRQRLSISASSFVCHLIWLLILPSSISRKA